MPITGGAGRLDGIDEATRGGTVRVSGQKVEEGVCINLMASIKTFDLCSRTRMSGSVKK